MLLIEHLNHVVNLELIFLNRLPGERLNEESLDCFFDACSPCLKPVNVLVKLLFTQMRLIVISSLFPSFHLSQL